MKKIKIGVMIILTVLGFITFGSYSISHADPCDIMDPEVNCPG